MGAWNSFYLQKTGDGQTCYESVATWSVYCKEIPFKLYEKVKEPAKRSWYDEHGDDEYIAASGLFMDSYTMKVEFACKTQDSVTNQTVTQTAQDAARVHVKNFLEYLRSSGMMKLYSTHTGIGRSDVRLDSVGDDAIWRQGDDGYWLLIFNVTFKVNDPVTDITLSSGALTVVTA